MKVKTSIKKLSGGSVHLPDREGVRRITIVALVQRTDVSADDVALFEDIV